jgi:hypothetical protein
MITFKQVIILVLYTLGFIASIAGATCLFVAPFGTRGVDWIIAMPSWFLGFLLLVVAGWLYYRVYLVTT